MGINILGHLGSACSCESTPSSKPDEPNPNPNPNPDPSNFKICAMAQEGNYTVATINYPNCTNYEGDKILVYEATWGEVSRAKKLDPHFCDNNKCLSPIARFEPTDRGYSMAMNFVRMLTLNEKNT